MDSVSEEFSFYYQKYGSKIKNLCYGYSNSSDEADDLTQETFYLHGHIGINLTVY